MNQNIFLITILSVFVVQVIALQTNLLQGNSKALDQSNYHIINGTTYYISSVDNTTALDARYDCNWGDMKLITFPNYEKYNMIVDYILNHTTYSGAAFWTSGRKMMSDWEWTATGKLFTYEWWSPGQPDNDDTCDSICVLFRATEGWFDSPCDLKRQFICEF